MCLHTNTCSRAATFSYKIVIPDKVKIINEVQSSMCLGPLFGNGTEHLFLTLRSSDYLLPQNI